MLYLQNIIVKINEITVDCIILFLISMTLQFLDKFLIAILLVTSQQQHIIQNFFSKENI